VLIIKSFIMMRNCMHAMAMLCCSFIISQTTFAKVWRVNNNTGVHADFTQLSTALTNAAVLQGDTMYLEGSPTVYNGATLSKKLVIIGTGYFLSENTGLQASPHESWISSITLDSLASGSSFYGIRLNQVFTNSNVDNITVSRCQASISSNNSVPNSRLSNWIINKSYVNSISFGNTVYVFENLQITNCIVSGPASIVSNINGLVRNNIITSSWATSNCYITNNIFLNFPTLNFTNCTIKYNIAQSNVLPAGNNNQNNISQASLFTLTGSTDGKYQLRQGSPAIGAGEPVNGITPDAGPFGTDDPYRISGIPPIPTIYELTVPASVPSSATSMTITVSTRSNN
jgi:hypothetical protein